MSSNNSNSNLAYPKLVRRALTSFSEKPNHFATNGRLTKGSSKPTASSYPKSNNATSSVGVVSGNFWQRKEYQKGLQTLLSHQEEKVLSQIIHRSGISGLAGVLNKMLIQFNVMRTGS